MAVGCVQSEASKDENQKIILKYQKYIKAKSHPKTNC